VTVVIGAFATTSAACTVVTALPIERFWVAPAVPVTTIASSETADCDS
jgi:hypothetical protein